MAADNNNSVGANAAFFSANFGGYVFAAAIVLLAYSAVDLIAPGYSTMFAMITLLGIVLFYFKKG